MTIEVTARAIKLFEGALESFDQRSADLGPSDSLFSDEAKSLLRIAMRESIVGQLEMLRLELASEISYDSGFTKARRELYESIDKPYGDRTVDFVRWIADSNVDRDGNIPGGHSVRIAQQPDRTYEFFLDENSLGCAYSMTDWDMLRRIFGALGATYDASYYVSAEDLEGDWSFDDDNNKEEVDTQP